MRDNFMQAVRETTSPPKQILSGGEAYLVLSISLI